VIWYPLPKYAINPFSDQSLLSEIYPAEVFVQAHKNLYITYSAICKMKEEKKKGRNVRQKQ
jgi:hypothetical protein